MEVEITACIHVSIYSLLQNKFNDGGAFVIPELTTLCVYVQQGYAFGCISLCVYNII